MKKSLKIPLIVALIVVLGLGTFLGFHFGFAVSYDKKVREYTVGDGSSLKIGVLSDTQLPGQGGTSKWTENLRGSLQTMKDKNVEALVFAGDFTDIGTNKAWKEFQNAYDDVFGNDKPIANFVMGNHDYWLGNFFWSFDIPSVKKMQRRFTRYTDERPFSHKVINGYHFINWSSENGSYDKSYSNEKWAREQIEIAVKDDPSKPIFVTTHLNPQDTIYGSDDWGNNQIPKVLKDYPQVVSLSGHSHYSLLDERSIWQGDYTAINTQSIDYAELEEGKYNGSIAKDAYGNDLADHNPTSMILDVTSDGVTITRVKAITGEVQKKPWVINAPYTKDSFLYTLEKQEKGNKAPYFSNNINLKFENTKSIDGKDIKVLSFDSASDSDFVHSYKVAFKDINGKPVEFVPNLYNGEVDTDGKIVSELLYFSDFTLGLEKMSKRYAVRLPSNLPSYVKTFEVTAIDSFGLISTSRALTL